MRRSVRLSFRLLDLPLLKECKTTCESTKCTSLIRILQLRSSLHLRAHRTALISRTLMCSLPPSQRQEAAVLHFHNLAGMGARRRWYLTTSSEALCRSRSSPFKLTKEDNFCTNCSSCSCLLEKLLREVIIGCRRRKLCKLLVRPGAQRETTSVVGLSKSCNPRVAPK